jgi:predicted ATPase
MNISSIRLQRFRGFVDATIQLKPLTVLLGPNSAGKSAFGHALAAMGHAHRIYSGGPQTTLTPTSAAEAERWPVDLGTTEDLRTIGEEGHIAITLRTRTGAVEFGFGGLSDSSELLLSWINHPGGEQSAPSTIHVLQNTDPTAIVVTGTSTSVVATESSVARHPSIQLRRVNVRQWQDARSNEPTQIIFNGLELKSARHESGTDHLLSGAARQDIKQFLESLTYLRANRRRPSRGYERMENLVQSIGYSGEQTPYFLLDHQNEPVTYKSPPGIPTTVEEASAAERNWPTVTEPLGEALTSWLRRLSLATSAASVMPQGHDSRARVRVSPESQQEHDITEVGFGISQIMPVLVAGLLQPRNGLYIVDLPEAHLHPRPQGGIADFFCSLALSGTSTLLETHSEMFFHQLRLRVAMNPELNDLIAVYFVDEPLSGRCRQPRQIGLTLDGEPGWPEGFFQEGWNVESQISAVREAQRRNKR